MSDIISELRMPTMCYDMAGRCCTESTMEEAADYIEQLEAKLAAAEADVAAQRDKVRVMREALDAISDSDPDASAGLLRDIANEALATTEDV